MSAHSPSVGHWIPVAKQRPPLIAEANTTEGFFLLLRHNPKRDAAGKYRMHLWFGHVPIDSAFWSPIPPLPTNEIPAAQESGPSATANDATTSDAPNNDHFGDREEMITRYRMLEKAHERELSTLRREKAELVKALGWMIERIDNMTVKRVPESPKLEFARAILAATKEKEEGK